MAQLLERALNKAIRPLGYKLIDTRQHNLRVDARDAVTSDYVLHAYVKADGSFDYERYCAIQEEGNKRKLGNVWVREENIEFLASYIRRELRSLSFGLCHGTRRGKEQEWFKKFLPDGVKVLGTEISETATQFPDTIQWDFHEVKPEWVNAVDFIYSNAFDHSYDPEKCLNAWMSTLRPGGLCILEHTDAHAQKGVSELDPFGAHLVQMPFLILKWGKGRYSVREILTGPVKNSGIEYLAFLVLEKHRAP